MADKKIELLGEHPNTLFSNSNEVSTASSKDRLKDFDATKQSAWLEFSSTVIQGLGEQIRSFPQVPPQVHKDVHCPPDMLSSQIGCAYAWLADKRREIAKALKHGPFRHQFGLINKAGFMSTDNFNLAKDLPSQKNLIYAQLKSCLLAHPNNVSVRVNQDQTEGTQYIIQMKLPPYERELLHQKNASSEFPFIEENDVVLTITFCDYGLEDSRTAIVIDHCPTPFDQNYRERSSYFKVQFDLIEPYFQSSLHWSAEQDIQDFLRDAGKIAYKLARLQPVGRGNSAIVEWMIRGLAKEKGIELGPFNQEDLAWDFKAFLTPDMDTYAQWFAEKAFVSYTLVESTTPIPTS